MGYRSEVAYVLRFKDKEMRELFVSIQRAKADPHINEALNELVEVEDNMLGYHADHVKWYDSYEDVQAHEGFMKACLDLFGDEYSTDYDNQAGYKFIRLGEETDDNIDKEGGNSEQIYDYVDWYRAINISFKRNTYENNEGETA
jgi:hypothetical protein